MNGQAAYRASPVREAVRTADGLELACYRWASIAQRSAPLATVALVHGLAEHAGRYAPLGEALNAAGIELVALDLRGHGLSPGPRAWVERIDDYLLDVQALLNASEHANRPLFLMGHSMGGALAALFAIEQRERLAHPSQSVAGLILSSPALMPGHHVPRWMIAASRIVSRVWPRYPAMKIDAALLARDPAVVAANRLDPLVHHGYVPARTGAALLAAMARIEAGRASLTLPVLVFHGSEDKLTEPDGSRAFAEHVGAPDRTLTIYEGSYHETLNDFGREGVIGMLIEWIVKRS